MRLLAELRRTGEWVLRSALVALLGAALWRSTHAPPAGQVRIAATSSTLSRALIRGTRDPRAGTLAVALDSLPTRLQRDWMVALRHAGMNVVWGGGPEAFAVDAERARDPASAVRITFVSAGAGAVQLVDSAGALDSVRSAARGALVETSDVVGSLRATRGVIVANVRVPDATTTREVLVLGRAGWESKFVLAALGEAGWHVRARLPAAPGVAVSDPALLPIDTTRYDIVIALDSTAADLATAIARFVSTGGGLVLAGSATDIPSLRALSPARTGARIPGRIQLDGDSVTRNDLPLRPLVSLRDDAVALERHPHGVAVAVRRAGNARVLTVGYDDSWRWRMLGGKGGPSAHRRWWSRVTSLAAPEHDASSERLGADAAPVAALVGALGSPRALREQGPSGERDTLPLLMLILAMSALLLETASRRFRGAR